MEFSLVNQLERKWDEPPRRQDPDVSHVYNICFKEASLPALFVGAVEQSGPLKPAGYAASHTWRNLHFKSVGDLIQLFTDALRTSNTQGRQMIQFLVEVYFFPLWVCHKSNPPSSGEGRDSTGTITQCFTVLEGGAPPATNWFRFTPLATMWGPQWC